MHRALEIDEIVEQVVFFLSNPDAYGRSKDLAGMACVRRSFWRPSAAALWRCPDTLRPFMNLLLPAAAGHHLTGDWVNEDLITSQIVPEAWQRFKLHARFVRVFHLALHEEDYEDCFPTFSTLRVLEFLQVHGPRPLFPAMTEFSISANRPEQLQWWSLFVTKTVTSLELRASSSKSIWTMPHSNDTVVKECLSCIGHHFPLLTHFGIFGVYWDAGKGLYECISIVRDGSRLASFATQVTPGTLRLVHHLASYSQVNELLLDFMYESSPSVRKEYSVSREDVYPAPPLLFTALRKLRLKGLIAEHVRFLEKLDAPLLGALSIQETAVSLNLSNRLEPLTQAIVHACPSLRTFELQFREKALSPIDLLPLTQCPSLRDITLNGSQSRSLPPVAAWGDRDVVQLTKAWPLLRTFEVAYEGYARITLHGFTSFVKNCPRLEYLAVDFDLNDRTRPLNRPIVTPGSKVLCFGSFPRYLPGSNDLFSAAQVVRDWWPECEVVLRPYPPSHAREFRDCFRDSRPTWSRPALLSAVAVQRTR